MDLLSNPSKFLSSHHHKIRGSKVVQGTTPIYLSPTSDFRIKWILRTTIQPIKWFMLILVNWSLWNNNSGLLAKEEKIRKKHRREKFWNFLWKSRKTPLNLKFNYSKALLYANMQKSALVTLPLPPQNVILLELQLLKYNLQSHFYLKLKSLKNPKLFWN